MIMVMMSLFDFLPVKVMMKTENYILPLHKKTLSSSPPSWLYPQNWNKIHTLINIHTFTADTSNSSHSHTLTPWIIIQFTSPSSSHLHQLYGHFRILQVFTIAERSLFFAVARISNSVS